MKTHGKHLALWALLSLGLTSWVWGEVVGKTAQPLDGRQARVAECTLGDFVADAARAALKAEVALIPASQIRPDTLPAGDLTREALVASLLFPEEPVVLVEAPGRMLAEALERSLSYLPRPSTTFLQVSGLTVSYRSSEAPGKRLVEVRVGATPLDPKQSYQVAMPSSLAKGAMGYYRVFSELRVKQTGPTLSEALVRYPRTNPNFTLTPGQRLLDLSRPAGRGT